MIKIIFSILCIGLIFVAPVSALDNGDQAPDFALQGYDGSNVKLSDLRGKIVVLEWFNRGCPFVQKHYRGGAMQALQNEFSEKGVVWLTINSTEKSHQDFMNAIDTSELKKQWNIKSAKMLVDSDGKVGHLYGAKVTPHMFVINAEGKIVYQGAIDDNSDVFGEPQAAKNFVRDALMELLSGKTVTAGNTDAYGCAIKYAG